MVAIESPRVHKRRLWTFAGDVSAIESAMVEKLGVNRRVFTNEGFEPSLAMSQRLRIGESSGAKALTFAGDVSTIESAMVDKLGVNRREFTNEGFEPSLAIESARAQERRL